MCPATCQLDWSIVPHIKHAVVSGIAVHCPAVVCWQTMRGDLQDALKVLQNINRIFARPTRRVGKGHPGWFRPVPCAIIAGECPKIALLCLTPPRIKDGSWRLVYYLAGDSAAICREGMNSFADCLRCASKALWTGLISWAALPTQNAKVERSISTPCRA